MSPQTDTVGRGIDFAKSVSWLLPMSTIYVPFILVPIFGVFVLSFFQGGSFGTLQFVGLDNYYQLFSSDVFYTVFRNTVLYAVSNTVLTVGGGLVLAVALQKVYERFRTLLRVALMIPYAIMSVGVGIIWSLIYHPRTGPLNLFIEWLGFEFQPVWLGDSLLALPSIIVVSTWWTIGFYTIIWLVGLASIDETYYEAARMDGANALQRFRYVTLPMLKPIGVFLLAISVLLALREFAIFWATTQGGPGHASEVFVTWMYQVAFEEKNLGLGSAIGVVLFVFSATVSVVILRSFDVMGEP